MKPGANVNVRSRTSKNPTMLRRAARVRFRMATNMMSRPTAQAERCYSASA